MNYMPGCTLRLFRQRLDTALSQVRDVKVVTSEPEMRSILHALVGQQAQASKEDTPDDAIYWFRGNDSMHIFELNELDSFTYQFKSDGWNNEIEPQFLIVHIDNERPDTDFVYIGGKHSNCFIAPKESRLNNVGGTEGDLLDKLCRQMLTMDADNTEQLNKLLKLLMAFPASDYHRYLLQMAE